MKILAVDDQESILELLKLSLSTSDEYQLATALSGQAALKLIESERRPFDCLLLDIQMPVMDGVTLCSKIRALPGYSHTPILMVTAMSDKKYIDDAFAAGATDYVTKPFDVFEIHARLKLARKFAFERKVATESHQDAEQRKGETNDTQNISLHEPIEIHGVDRALGFVAFENYLLQLTRGALLLSSVFAIKIEDVDRVYKISTTTEFRNILTAAAEKISESTAKEGNLFSYRGNGVFLCINHKRMKMETGGPIQSLQDSKFRAISADACLSPARTHTFVVGEQLPLGVLTRASTLGSLRSAADKIELKVEKQKKAQNVPDYLIESRAQAKNLSEQRKMEYEGLLRDSLERSLESELVKKQVL